MKQIAQRPPRYRSCPLLAMWLLGACSYTDWVLPHSDGAGAGGSGMGGVLPHGASSYAGLTGLSVGGVATAEGGTATAGEAFATADDEAGAGGKASAGPSAGAAGSGIGSEAQCDLSAEFGTPVPVSFADDRDRVDGRLSSDETTIYFASFGDIWVATRSDRTATFDHEQVLLHDRLLAYSTPSLTRDGLTLYYGMIHATEDTTAALPAEGLYVSKRATVHDSFGAGSRLSEFPASAGSPFITPSGRGLYYSSNDDIFQSTQGALAFGQFLQLKGLDGGGSYSYETLPLVSDDERTIYFACLQYGSVSYDIWRATRNDLTGNFLSRSKVHALSSSTNDYPNWLSPDGCRIYLHRYADANWGSPQLMIASKPALPSH